MPDDLSEKADVLYERFSKLMLECALATCDGAHQDGTDKGLIVEMMGQALVVLGVSFLDNSTEMEATKRR